MSPPIGGAHIPLPPPLPLLEATYGMKERGWTHISLWREREIHAPCDEVLRCGGWFALSSLALLCHFLLSGFKQGEEEGGPYSSQDLACERESRQLGGRCTGPGT